ncbi:MAG TPA: peptide-methionine (S)-S-oxide reductase MsrA [Rhizomicrobium sp.]|jgi:peptide-methionine (S)-S-oxide reductase|nr:peptide-methionine (S)-S-oxide reductase MsrA [Rhizomicrobium sp.]
MLRTLRNATLAAGIAALCSLSAACADAIDKAVPAAAVDAPKAGAAASETAVLAGGCFWGMQGVFEHVRGVTHVAAGYSGGARATAFYPLVGTETTGHAESVQVTFDPRVVSYGEILRVYFSVAHDPTELDRQGPDSGPSYRSEIFFASPLQEKIAHAYVAQLSAAHVFGAPIVTRIEKLNGFFNAEGYHQDYLIHNPTDGYIMVNDLPKIDALKRVFPALYREKPMMFAG